jgi:HD-GYP domain-containing protein (c-di-GMP phosphodiesterase class II)
MGTEKLRPGRTEERWQARPILSLVLRVVATLAPAAVALAFSVVASHLVAPPPGTAPRIAWWLGLSVLSLAVLFGAQRMARRLLPLAALLKLSLVFPDAAPARFKLARKTGRPRDLERLVERARAAGLEGGEALAPQTVLELVAALSVHDRATRGHSERVRIFTDLIATELKLPQPDQDRLRWAALLHDVGKLNVSRTILRKPGYPTPAEWRELKTHPAHGMRLIAPIAPWLGPWAMAVEHHHERYDGAGYPSGLRGLDISLGGRIVAVADAYETMTTARPYKRPFSPTAARNELVACSGTHFDPTIVRAFLNVSLGRLWRTIGVSAWISQVPLLPQISSGLSVAGTQGLPMAARGMATLALVAGASAAAPSPVAASGPSASTSVSAPLSTPQATAARTAPTSRVPSPRPAPGPPRPKPTAPPAAPKGSGTAKPTPVPKATPVPKPTPVPKAAKPAKRAKAHTTASNRLRSRALSPVR